MNGFKNSVVVFVVGVVVGVVMCYLIFCKNRSVENIKTTVLVEKNSEEITSLPTTNIKQNNKQVEIITKLETPHYGLMQVSQTISRESLQYKHSLGVEGGYWLKYQLPFVGVTYSYKNYLVSAKVGYSMTLKDIDYGIGIGMKFGF